MRVPPLDASERPVGREPLAHGAERSVAVRVARPYPGVRTRVVVTVAPRVDIDTTDHVADRRIEHRVREPRAVAEVARVPRGICLESSPYGEPTARQDDSLGMLL